MCCWSLCGWISYRREWEWPPLGLLQQVPSRWSLPPSHVSGETGWKELLQSRGVPADPPHHQPAGPQGWDGLNQPPGVQVAQSHLLLNTVFLCLVCVVEKFKHLPYIPPPSQVALWYWRRKRRVQWAAGCPGGVCSWAGSSCCPSAGCPRSSPCCTVLNTAEKSPPSGSCLWASRCSRASLYCSLSRCPNPFISFSSG